jgi:signal transduction histidine kinase
MVTRGPTLAVLAAAVSGVVLVCLLASTEWVGRPFMGFLLGRNRIVAPIGLAHWTGFRAGVPFGAQLERADGAPVASVPRLVERTWATPLGTPVRYEFATPTGTVERTIRVMEFTLGDYLSLYGVWIVNGGLFLCLGFLVAYLKPGRPASTATLVFGLAWGLTLLLSLGDFYRYHFRSLYAVAQAVAPAALVFLALTFPDRPLPRRWPWLAAGFGALTALHAGADVWLYERDPRLWMRFFDASLVYMACCALAACVVLGRFYRRAPDDDRARLQVVAVGALAAFGAPAAVHLAAALAGVQLPLNLLPVATAIFPVAVGYAILKHDVLSLDPLLTRSVFWAGFTAAVTIAYVALLGLATAVEPATPPGLAAWVPFLFTLAVVAVAAPMRRAAQALVDRLFFRTRYDPEATLEAVSQSLTASLDRDEIAAGIQRTLAATIAPAPCLLLLPDGAGALRGPGGAALAADDPVLAAAAGAGAQVVPLERTPDAGRLAAAGVTLVVPLRVDGWVEGVLALGRKQSGALYGARDLALLRTLGNQAAIALRNAASYAALRELTSSLEARVAERTADLARTHEALARADKLASLGRLVAGVAHEINNPVAFVSASVDLIHDAALKMRAGLNGDDPSLHAALDRLLENAAICRDGAGRAARIVRELTAFSRASHERREPTDLHAALDRTLQLLRGETRDRITIVREYGDVPWPPCDTGEIDQVLMNLVSNAVQAIDGPGEIRLRTWAGDGSVWVEVEDTGPGIPRVIRERIFEPFFTTKAGRGTGLGLSIAQAMVARHGGDLTLQSRPGAGTTFRIRLPLAPPATTRETV